MVNQPSRQLALFVKNSCGFEGATLNILLGKARAELSLQDSQKPALIGYSIQGVASLLVCGRVCNSLKSPLFLNPVSGSDAGAAQLPALNEQLRERGGAMDIVMRVAAGDAREGAADAALPGYDTSVVVMER